MELQLLNTLRDHNPIVFNIANFVTVQDVANGLNALGASPIMSAEVQEAETMVQIAGAVCINLGTLTTTQIDQMRVVGKLANQYHKPVVLDPVAVGAVPYRKKVALELLADFQVDVIRGNAGEIAAWTGKRRALMRGAVRATWLKLLKLVHSNSNAVSYCRDLLMLLRMVSAWLKSLMAPRSSNVTWALAIYFLVSLRLLQPLVQPMFTRRRKWLA